MTTLQRYFLHEYDNYLSSNQQSSNSESGNIDIVFCSLTKESASTSQRALECLLTISPATASKRSLHLVEEATRSHGRISRMKVRFRLPGPFCQTELSAQDLVLQ
jgi:hypothetical protein